MLSQKTLQFLLNSAPANMTFAQYLTNQGYSTQISHLKINVSPTQKINFSGCQFDDVQFSGHFQQATFEQASFNNSNFKKANFAASVFKGSTFKNCAFVDSNLKGSSFINTELNATKFWNSDFSSAAFINSTIDHSLFAKVKFDNMLDYGNKVTDLHIVFTQNYHPVDYAFNQAQGHHIKPIVAIVGDANWYSTPHTILQKYSSDPITISQYPTENMNVWVLESEVEKVFQEIKQHGLSYPSIVQQVLHSDQPMINSIKASAYQMMENADAVWIPGGPDLHPAFYGEQNIASYPHDDYYREILEFSLTEAALSMNKPILGICHGSQLVNVYYGGTLHQHVEGHGSITPELEVHTHDGLLGSVIDGPIRGPSYHHQAVKDVAHPLQVVASYEGVVKATQSTDGSKVMLCQFHPEYESDKNSENILNQFINLSAQDKVKAKAIQLSDVVDFGTSLGSILVDEAPIAQPTPTISATLQGYVGNMMPMFITDMFHTHTEPVAVM